jgi:FMN phosphatase YigB (HAD superfamily)
LHERGYRLGLVSNAADDQNTQILVDKVGIRPYLEVVLSSAAVGYRKPNPRIFQAALDALAVPAERSAMVGDMLGADILGARNAGLISVWVTQWADAPDNLAHKDTIRPDITVERLSDLLEVFTKH